MRTLLRSWFFRIFAGLAIIGLGIFNVAMNVEASGAPWIYKAMAASIPYANLIILNLGQAIVAVFLASEFLKQDKKNDTVEVIYARSMSNGQYILGKTLGILSVFLVLNVIILVMGIGFSFLNNSGSRDILSYFIYPLLISLPTLVFILGLSFFMMVMVKNQAVTFILLLGYIALTIFYLSEKAFHIFDYIAYNVPMMFSSISGFGDFEEIIYHRLIYFLIGTGFIFLTVFKLNRLPQPYNRAFIPLIAGLLFVAAGAFFIKKYLDLKNSVKEFKQEALALNNHYTHYPNVTVLKCNLQLEHRSSQISAEANLVGKNETSQVIDTLILSLNPGLNVESLTISQKPVSFERKLHLILLRLPVPLQPGDETELMVKYSGSVDERICFLDKTEMEDNFNAEVFTLRKRFAFLQNDYVCLTSESFWYPTAWTGYASKRPMYYKADLAEFTLNVKTAPGLTAVSQGNCTDKGNGSFKFTPGYPLPKLSLIIGEFKKSSVMVDSIEYSLYHIKRHDYYAESFKNIYDTVGKLIRDLKQEYGAELGFN
jgi:ABC-type transport system involved in multi-copper enzyme maturation permease subunit